MNRTKRYYNSITNTNIFTVESSTTILFNEYILKILDAIWLQDYVKFYVEIDKLNELKSQYPNYKYTDSLNIMVQLVDIVRNFREQIVDLKSQLDNLEETLANDTRTGTKISMPETQIIQDTSIKLEYMQYLLMFDINETRGIFLEANLERAREVLKENGFRLRRYDVPLTIIGT
jgi:hypothetical protein